MVIGVEGEYGEFLEGFVRRIGSYQSYLQGLAARKSLLVALFRKVGRRGCQIFDQYFSRLACSIKGACSGLLEILGYPYSKIILIILHLLANSA